ncbi:HAD-IA family hydrolase [Sphingomonas echinoides]|uniref:HAD-IA family hydrolase n=1 Tax=Sphingomonas echinoides TaxID=59803 RepID=UPI0024136AA9|nr:HAD-IA family hydrolase [Sphingomonas echinoides]
MPHDGWAIFTAATSRLTEARLEAAGLNAPSLFITAEDIPVGKSAPNCYSEPTLRLGKNVTRCVVFEDAPAGIQSGRAAGAEVVAVTQRVHS